MQVALGRDSQTEKKPKLHLLSQRVAGQCGLLFTNEDPEQLQSFFSTFSSPDYPRAGFKATKTVQVNEGPLDKELYPASIETRLRQLGLPTRLQQGVIHLQGKYTICKGGELLSPEQAKLLKIFDEKMCLFTLKLLGLWHKNEYKQLVEDDYLIEETTPDFSGQHVAKLNSAVDEDLEDNGNFDAMADDDLDDNNNNNDNEDDDDYS